MRRALLLLLVPATVSASATWQKGAICNGLNYATVHAKDMLRGKHLKVLDLVWAPFATIDPTAPKGWRGMDVDLLDRMALLLGFTYEMADMGYPDAATGETWTGLVDRHQHHADLIASWWTQTTDRRNVAIQLKGHLDLSPVLVSRRHIPVVNGFSAAQLFKWADPFTWQLWVMVIGLVIFSGVADWWAERHVDGNNFLASLYEYCAGVLWGGFEHPLSAASGVYQVIVGFVVLVFVSSYTANLAAFITVSAQPTLTASSVDMMLANGLNLCAMPGGYMQRFAALWPRMPVVSSVEGTSEAAQALDSGRVCDALLTPKNNYDGWKADSQFCHFEIAETLWSEMGGWMTNWESECVQWAIEWGLLELQNNGTIDSIYRQYMPVAPCATSVAVEQDSFESTGGASIRRRLGAAVRGAGPAPATHQAAGGAGRGRQLRGNAGDAGSSSSTEASTPQMEPLDFVGIFFLWGFATLVIFFLPVFRRWYAMPRVQQLVEKVRTQMDKVPWLRRIVAKVEPELDTDADGDGILDEDEGVVGKDPNACGINRGVPLNNESAMLREVMRQLGVLQKNIRDAELAGLLTDEDRKAAKEKRVERKAHLKVKTLSLAKSATFMAAMGQLDRIPSTPSDTPRDIPPNTHDADGNHQNGKQEKEEIEVVPFVDS